MVEIAWSEPALNDLEAIAECIALEDPVAAASVVQRVFDMSDGLRIIPRAAVGRLSSAADAIAGSSNLRIASSVAATATRSSRCM